MRLASEGMRGGGEGVAREREAELSEARESWPESHILITAISLTAPQRLAARPLPTTDWA